MRLVAAAASTAIAIAAIFSSDRAFAIVKMVPQDGGAGTPTSDDPASMLADIKAQSQSLQTQDCAIACKALASIRRATARLCAIDPGDRCADARAVEQDAIARVRAACPDCSGASVGVDQRPAPTRPPPPAEKGADVSTSEQAAQPGKGGCASCRAAPAGDVGGDALVALCTLFAVAGIAGVKRRRR